MENSREGKVKTAITLAILANVIWGFGNYFIELSFRYASVAVTLGYRFTLSFLLLNIWLIFGKGKINLKGKNIKGLIIYTIIEPVCFFLESYGIYLTNASISGIIAAVSPVFAVILAAIFLKEYPTKLQAFFCLLPIVGVIIITLNGASLGVVSVFGIIVLLLYAVSSGAYKAVNRGIADDFTAFERTYFLMGGCFVTYVVYALIETKCDYSLIEPLTHFEFIWPTVCLAILNSILSNTLINYSAKYMSATKMATFGSIITLTATISGVLLLNEPFSFTMLIGMALILIGVYVVTTKGE